MKMIYIYIRHNVGNFTLTITIQVHIQEIARKLLFSKEQILFVIQNNAYFNFTT